MTFSSTARARAAFAPLVFGVGLAAASPALSQPLGQDPWEGANRTFYRVEGALDRALIRPLAVFYKHVAPRPLRSGLKNAIANLAEPSVAVNDLLQGRGGKAGETVARFVVNSTVGVAGLFDVATPAALPHHANDFGLTLARYGVKPGPYLFLPLVGPTNVRDAVGGVVNIAFNPLTYAGYPGQAEVAATTTAAKGLDARNAADGQLKALDASAVDPYATLRAYAEQTREAEVNGGVVEIETLPNFDVEPPPAPAPAPTKVSYTPSADGGGS
jgi:phospholipid-binding lipoprotein MlaA